jgi:mannose-6-phosphate isomerase-like protein (cupin superfamily)
MSELKSGFHGSFDKWLGRLPTPEGQSFAVAFKHGSLRLGLFAPRGTDLQQPHAQDEMYVVIRGEGQFINGDTRYQFGPGDVLFVPAGVEHRFEDFSDDLAVWVVFYGPEGGERIGMEAGS